jgi:hypothetical protein
MMRDLTRRSLRVLNGEGKSPIDLIEIRPIASSEDSTIYFCSGGSALTFDGHDYLPVNLGRAGIDEVLATESGSIPSTQVVIGNINTEMAQFINSVELEGATVTVREIDRTLLANARDAITITSGELREPTLTDSLLTFKVVGVLGQIDALTVPRRLWQPKCNYRFGSPSCGVDLLASPNTIVTAVEATCTKNFVIIPNSAIVAAGSPTDVSAFWAEGTISFVDGPNATQGRPIQRVTFLSLEWRFYVRLPFLSDPDVGDALLLQRGCPKTIAGCIERQGNADQFGGYPYVPYVAFPPVIEKNLSDDEEEVIWDNP